MYPHMRWCHPAYWMLLSVFALGCISPNIGYDYDRSAGISVAIIPTHGLPAHKKRRATGACIAFVDTRIRTAIDAQLRAKGYTVSVNGQPEFLVAYQVGMKDMIKGHPLSTTPAIECTVPTQPLATYSHTTKARSDRHRRCRITNTVWQASAQAEVDQSLGPKERDERIGTVVRAMLAHFPPQ